MKRIFFFAILIFPVASIFGQVGDPLKKDLAAYQGKWQAVSIYQSNGEEQSEDKVKTTILTVKGNTFSITTEDQPLTGEFKLLPNKAIDVFIPSAENPQIKLLGVYEIKGAMRRSSFAEVGKGRPSKIAKEPGFTVLEWKKIK